MILLFGLTKEVFKRRTKDKESKFTLMGEFLGEYTGDHFYWNKNIMKDYDYYHIYDDEMMVTHCPKWLKGGIKSDMRYAYARKNARKREGKDKEVEQLSMF